MDGSSFGFYDGYTRQYCPPAAKRFRHAKWNGMPEGAFVQNLPNPHGPNVGLQNRSQRGVAYGQQSGGDFSRQSVMHLLSTVVLHCNSVVTSQAQTSALTCSFIRQLSA